jgi:hypothetical protein
LSILNWKWDDISMDFIMGLLLTARKFDLIWVIVDRLTKSAHFVPVNTNYKIQKYAKIYITRVVYLHGVLKAIISDRGSQFVTRFWEPLHASLGTHLIHSSTYNPQTDDQILEVMLRAYVMEHQGSWDKNLPWTVFSYNNSYQESLKMTPFEVLYGCQCHTPLNWIHPREKMIFGPNLIEEVEVIVSHIQDN